MSKLSREDAITLADAENVIDIYMRYRLYVAGVIL